MAKRHDDRPVVIPMSFKDAVKRILHAGPAPSPKKKVKKAKKKR
jgi:hypothetical protein